MTGLSLCSDDTQDEIYMLEFNIDKATTETNGAFHCLLHSKPASLELRPKVIFDDA